MGFEDPRAPAPLATSYFTLNEIKQRQQRQLYEVVETQYKANILQISKLGQKSPKIPFDVLSQQHVEVLDMNRGVARRGTWAASAYP